jgi:hypothetical protein
LANKANNQFFLTTKKTEFSHGDGFFCLVLFNNYEKKKTIMVPEKLNLELIVQNNPTVLNLILIMLIA